MERHQVIGSAYSAAYAHRQAAGQHFFSADKNSGIRYSTQWATLDEGAGVTLCEFAGKSLAWRLRDYASEAKNSGGGNGEEWCYHGQIRDHNATTVTHWIVPSAQ